MKIVIAGGTGQIGGVLARAFTARGDRVVVIGRGRGATVTWDGRTLGPWRAELDGADVAINLAGRSVNCRYTEDNLRAFDEVVDPKVKRVALFSGLMAVSSKVRVSAGSGVR